MPRGDGGRGIPCLSSASRVAVKFQAPQARKLPQTSALSSGFSLLSLYAVLPGRGVKWPGCERQEACEVRRRPKAMRSCIAKHCGGCYLLSPLRSAAFYLLLPRIELATTTTWTKTPYPYAAPGSGSNTSRQSVQVQGQERGRVEMALCTTHCTCGMCGLTPHCMMLPRIKNEVDLPLPQPQPNPQGGYRASKPAVLVWFNSVWLANNRREMPGDPIQVRPAAAFPPLALQSTY
jgi:hypothetical protein